MMNNRTRNTVCIGEVAIELTRGADGRFGLTYSGDAFSTAVYLARAGIPVAFASALGDDPFSESVCALAAAESIKVNFILRISGRLPELNVIDSGSSGERRIHSWHDAAPARELFELPDWNVIAAGLLAADAVYFSGATLARYSNVGLGRLLATLELAQQKGARVVFDGNYRARDWNGEFGRARIVFIEVLKRVDIALPAFDDEAALWGDASPEATVGRLQAFGIGEIVVKNGAAGALVATQEKRELVPVPQIVTPIDATAAGASFNAAYLAARLGGEAPLAAAGTAHRLASEVIRHRGAIMPRAAAMH